MAQETRFCQSCGMPLSSEHCGTEADGSKSQYYCVYCYRDGAFTSDCTMEEMIEFCVPHMTRYHTGLTPDNARAAMMKFFPQLKRWKKD